MTEEMKEALEECRTYNRMGGLNDDIIADIAFNSRVDRSELIAAWKAEQ